MGRERQAGGGTAGGPVWPEWGKQGGDHAGDGREVLGEQDRNTHTHIHIHI